MARAVRLQRVVYDPAPIVDALLPAFKRNSRIVNPEDDDEASEVLARSISFIEIRSGIAIATAAYSWIPIYPESSVTVPGLPVPVRGVYAFTTYRGGVDVSNEYWIAGDNVDPYALGVMMRDGGLYAGDMFELKAGFDVDHSPSVDPLAAQGALVDVILRYAGYLWEFREAATLGQSANLLPDWFNESMAVFWVPRC